MLWMVGGDFNVIHGDEENIGGLSVYPHEYEDFTLCLNSCVFSDVYFSGNPFTWWNGRVDESCIFKRQDRVVFNHSLLNVYGDTGLQHLSRIVSDHAPLLLTYGVGNIHIPMPFKFFKFWTEREDFKNVFQLVVLRPRLYFHSAEAETEKDQEGLGIRVERSLEIF